MRVITGIYCADKRRHHVGDVCADADGFLVSFTAEVWHTDGIFGSDKEVVHRLPVDDELDIEDQALRSCLTEELPGYCKRCNKAVVLNAGALRQAALKGAKNITVAFADTSDNAWKQAGNPPMYPPGMTRHKADPR